MANDDKGPTGPDLSKGVSSGDLPDGAMMAGHIGDDEMLLARQNGKLFALSAHCTHYHGPLADGLLVGYTVRCPWHHARFNIETGEAIAAPALNPLTCWQVEERDGKVFVKRKKAQPGPKTTGSANEHFVIVGGGAAGFAAAEMLRRHGFAGRITMLSNDDATPVDRPNLSKDYLAGSAPEDWVPLRGDDWYAENKIDLRLKTEVASLDAKNRELTLGNGSKMKFVANLMVAIHNVSAAEAFVLGMKAGLSPEMIYQVAGDGAGSSRMFQVRGPQMVAGKYDEATMKVEVWQKDMKIIGDFAARHGVPTPLFNASAAIYNAAMSQGYAEQDTAAVCAVLESMARIKR